VIPHHRPHTFAATVLAVTALALAALAGCGGGGDNEGEKTATTSNVSGSISMIGVWTGDEQKSFQAVIDAFNKQYPKVKVKYTSAGDNVPTVLGTAVEGGNPPDMAAIAQPGLVKEFQQKGAVKSVDFVRPELQDNYASDYVKLGTINGKLYSFVYKGSNKSTVWYNVSAFKDAGVSSPKTWDDFLNAAKTVKSSGVPAYSIGGADGWTLTDLFENIYLRQAGEQKYDQLTDHSIKWTDPSVKQALSSMAQILGDTSNIAGGTSGALQTEFPASVENVFQDPPKAAMVIEADFVPGVVATKTKLKAGTGYDVFAFPEIGDSAGKVVGGGDSIAVFRDTPAVRAFAKYLASPEGAEVWVKRGGFSSPNKNVPDSAYPDETTKRVALALADAQTVRFDMSDLAPASFGGTAGQGEWKILQDFLSDPKDVDGTAAKLESSASKAFASQ
jgi:alpha-glucoside transport system substrate-binding protein